MRVLIVGGGGREHALGWKIAQSPQLEKLFFAPGNPGTSELGENLQLVGDEQITTFCREQKIDLVVVGPEAPLVDGIADVLAAAGIACFGPDRFAAQLEGSKAFSKEVMDATGVPTAAYAQFTDLDKALAYAQAQPHPLVIKADGLAAGKGVIICATPEESKAALKLTMEERKFGEAGAKVVVEEFLVGTEASFHLICDGERYLPLITARDHKTLLDGNKGPNTGGMGTFAPNPLVDDALTEKIQTDICRPVLEHMSAAGHPFRGVLFVGLMLTEQGPKVLEFNVRFGDPETQVMLPMLDYDLLPVLHGAALGKLPSGDYPYRKGAAVCLVMASAGYPNSARKGDLIEGLGNWEKGSVFHAGTRSEDDKVYTNGGRVLGITAWGDALDGAREQAYGMLEQIHFDGKQFRRDIGVIDDKS